MSHLIRIPSKAVLGVGGALFRSSWNKIIQCTLLKKARVWSQLTWHKFAVTSLIL